MVTDNQVRRLRKLNQKEMTFAAAAAKAGMDEKTARKYRTGGVPSEVQKERDWRTRKDPFEAVWEDLQGKLELNPGLEAKTLFEYLKRKSPGRYSDGQLRTLQRRVKVWRGLEGPAKEVFFPQIHTPGVLCQSDFTHMKGLAVTINDVLFDHLILHFVLTYSNWEAGTICFSECFESLSEGVQNGLWELGMVPKTHQTDSLTSAVQKLDHPEEFTQRYGALLRHYGLQGRRSQPNSPHELGDAEQRHNRFKKAVEQQLLLRGSRDFTSREEYEGVLGEVFDQLNAGRQKRLQEELEVMRRLPAGRLESYKKIWPVVSSSSTINVYNNVYSVNSRLIGEKVQIRLYADHLEIWYAQRCVEKMPRLRGTKKHRVQYRHVIEWLKRKPGAFENYRYREDMFPTSRFRMVYDGLKATHTVRVAAKRYLEILDIAAKESEALVDRALECLIWLGGEVTVADVKYMVENWREQQKPRQQEVQIEAVRLADYDALLERREAG